MPTANSIALSSIRITSPCFGDFMTLKDCGLSSQKTRIAIAKPPRSKEDFQLQLRHIHSSSKQKPDSESPLTQST